MTTESKILIGVVAVIGLFAILFKEDSFKEDIRSRLEKKSIEDLERDLIFLVNQEKYEAAAIVLEIINQKKESEKHIQGAGEEAALSDTHNTGRGDNAAVRQIPE